MSTPNPADYLLPEHQRTLILAEKYEALMRSHGSPGYDVFWGARGPEIVRRRDFKTFNTVREWLETGGWKVSLDDYGWQGYLAFVFSQVRRPKPWQLKNEKLLREYLRQPVENPDVPRRTPEEMAALYRHLLS